MTVRLRLLRGICANDSQTSFQELAAREPHVARAIAAMKSNPSRRWTVAALARVGGLSRAAFARRFARALGTSPLRWLTEHRLHLAQTRLLETDLKLAGIASEIGYESEFAFAKAFKRIVGVPPGIFRRRASYRTTLPIVRAAA